MQQVIVDTLRDGLGRVDLRERPAGRTSSRRSPTGARSAPSGSDLDRSHTFEIGGVKGRSVLLWLTQLPTGDNGKHYVDVTEVRVA